MKVFLVALKSCMLIRFRVLPVLAFLLLTFLTQRTEAQATLTSIAVTSAITPNSDVSTLSTGSFAALTVTGTFSDGSTQDVTNQASWSSSDASSVSVSTTGVLTAIKGTASPVTITASVPGVKAATIIFSVVPQTALFGVDGQNVYVYDVTFDQVPAYVTKINYSSVPETAIYSAPMAFSEDGTSLYVAKFSPDSSSASDFIIQAFNVSQKSPTQFTPTLSITSGLCYPSGLAVKAGKLYVVNAGPKAHVTTVHPPASCSDVPTPNIQVYDEFNNLSLLETFCPKDVNDPNSVCTRLIDSPDAGPIGIAASIDASDRYVYVTDPYYKTAKNGKPAGPGTIHVIDSNVDGLNNDSIVQHITVQMWPVGVTAGTSYPSGATSPNNIVYFVGPSLGIPSTESIQALHCVPSGVIPTCTVYGSAPYQFANPGSSNLDLWPVSMSVSPDGKNVYLADPTVSDALSMFSVEDPTKITEKSYVCTTCHSPTGIAANSAGDSVFAVFSNDEIQQLDVPAFTPPAGGGLVTTPYRFQGLVISPNPEAQLKITSQSGSSATGFTIKGTLTVNGNFQNTFNTLSGGDANQMGFSWGDGEFLSEFVNTPTGSQSFDVQHTFAAIGSSEFSTANITTDANPALSQSTLGIIGSISVGPVKVTISPSGSQTSPVKLVPGGTIRFQASVYPPPPSDQSVVWQVNGQTGGGPSVGTIDNSSDPQKNGLYTAPTSGSNISSTPKITITAVPNADTTKPSDPVFVAVSGPVVTLDPANTLPDFGDQPVTTPATSTTPRTVTLTNSGSENLSISQIAIVAGGTNPAPNDFIIQSNGCQNSVATGSKCAISVAFAPTSTGERSAALSITDNAAGSPQMISLSGTGVTPSQVRLSPNPLDFGTQNVGASASMTVTLTNAGQTNLILGTNPLTIVGDNPGDTPEDFSINPNQATTTCIANLSVAQNESCSISIIFKPTASGERTAELHVIDNAGGTAGTLQKVQLEGAGASSVGIVISLFPSNPDVEAATTQRFTANFQPAQSAGPVTWSVSGSSCGGHACGSIDTNGLYSASPTLTGLAADTVTATLVSNTAVSGSTQVNLFLTPSLNTNGQSQTVTAGQTATYNLSLVGGTGDPTKPLTVECHKSLLPTGVSCSSVTVQPGANNASFALTVSTTGSQGLALLSLSTKFISIGLIFPVGAIALCLGRRRNCNGRRVLLVVALLGTVLALGALGCGTNGSFSQPTPKNFSQTPTGTYTIQLDGVGPSGIADEGIGHIQLVVK
jgi:hypothetical protein